MKLHLLFNIITATIIVPTAAAPAPIIIEEGSPGGGVAAGVVVEVVDGIVGEEVDEVVDDVVHAL